MSQQVQNSRIAVLSDRLNSIVLDERSLQDPAVTDEAISILRSLNTLALSNPPQVLVIAIPAVLRASLLLPINNVIAREAGITMFGIGFSAEALRGYIAILSMTDDDLKAASLRIIEERTRDNRLILQDAGLDILLESFLNLVDSAPISAAPPPLFAAYFTIVSSPNLAPLTAAARLEAILRTINNPIGHIVSPTVTVRGVEPRRRALSVLEEVIASHQNQASIVGTVAHPSLGPFVIRMRFITELLIRSRDGVLVNFNPSFADGQTVWSEVITFEPTIRRELTDRLLGILADELIIMASVPREARERGGVPFFSAGLLILNFLPLLGREAAVLIPQLELFLNNPNIRDLDQLARATIDRIQAST